MKTNKQNIHENDFENGMLFIAFSLLHVFVHVIFRIFLIYLYIVFICVHGFLVFLFFFFSL